MNRKDFIINTCTACLSTSAIAVLFSSCRSTQHLTGKLGKDGLMLNTADFEIKKNGKTAYRSFIIIKNESLQYPICVFRFTDAEYSALWMRCTHQGAELQASGEYLQCPAHGSEFNNKGIVTTGPANKNLQSFPVTVTNNELFIDLRKQ